MQFCIFTGVFGGVQMQQRALLVELKSLGGVVGEWVVVSLLSWSNVAGTLNNCLRRPPCMALHLPVAKCDIFWNPYKKGTPQK